MVEISEGSPLCRFARTGQLLYLADLAEIYDFTDVDGTRIGNFYRTLGLIP